MFGTVGILMALFLDTAGGAWDNAKNTLNWEIMVERTQAHGSHYR
jgi:Na+/H+-translocating membrane pyrophosphatase